MLCLRHCRKGRFGLCRGDAVCGIDSVEKAFDN